MNIPFRRSAPNMRTAQLFACVALGLVIFANLAEAQTERDHLELSSSKLRLIWRHDASGWRIAKIDVAEAEAWRSLEVPSGAYTYLYSSGAPSGYMVNRSLSSGARTFVPSEAKPDDKGGITFQHATSDANVTARWWIEESAPTDVRVELKVETKRKGYYSLATPTLAAVSTKDLGWGLIPGAWYGSELQPDLELSTTYSMGIPVIPMLSKEANTMTLCALLSTRSGVTFGVAPNPGTSSDPWPKDQMVRDENRVGLSLMDRHSQLTPVGYAPVHGGPGSLCEPGQTLTLGFRYVVQAGDWFPAFRHVAADIYKFSDLLKLQKSTQSLADRMSHMQVHMQDDQRSKWNVITVDGRQIGMYGSKNSDVAATYMVAHAAGDQKLREEKLPLIRSFKLAQQRMTPGFFQHAASGEYPVEPQTGVNVGGDFLSEMGNWVEPLYTTKYTLLDMGNMLLFEPGDQELRERVRLAADRLLKWQHDDGGFDVAYDRESHALTFPNLKDLRPTWYGFLVAHRILGDAKYLVAARKGADWFVRNAVEKGWYLGVCGDAVNKWDFTTAQSAQTLLDLFDATGDVRYRAAGIEAAKAYATSIFTHPIPTTEKKMAGGIERHDWEITQAGLGVEHIRGTASGAGPIYLASHAGLFVRVYELTKESLFLDMARAAARGRSAAAEEKSGVAIYYWKMLDDVAKKAPVFPWHAWWQIGWITDYLYAEAHLRSGGEINFPRGFVTPKVGPHQAYGFAPGVINGEPASMWIPAGLITSSNPNVEYLSSKSTRSSKLLIVLLNQMPGEEKIRVQVDPAKVVLGQKVRWTKAGLRNGQLRASYPESGAWDVTLPSWGHAVLTLDYEEIK